MQRNTAGQSLTVFVFDSATNLPKTGAGGSLTAYVNKDDAGTVALADTAASEVDADNAPGDYLFTLTQGETDGDKLAFSCKSSTSGLVAIPNPKVAYTVPAGFSLGRGPGGYGPPVYLGDYPTTAPGAFFEYLSRDIAGVVRTLSGAEIRVTCPTTGGSIQGEAANVFVAFDVGAVTGLNRVSIDFADGNETLFAAGREFIVYQVGGSLSGGTLESDLIPLAYFTVGAGAGYATSVAIKAKTDQLTFTTTNVVDATGGLTTQQAADLATVKRVVQALQS